LRLEGLVQWRGSRRDISMVVLVSQILRTNSTNCPTSAERNGGKGGSRERERKREGERARECGERRMEGEREREREGGREAGRQEKMHVTHMSSLV
jgi:hypothetical protein